MRVATRDVLVAGGGPAGASVAIALARAGLDVLLVDAGDGVDAKIGEGLPPSARALLRDLGVLEDVLADGHRISPGTLAVWGGSAAHANDFLFQLHGQGLQLDRARFDARLRAAAVGHGAEYRGATHARLLEPGDATRPHGLSLRAADGATDTVRARWLIDASGRAASFARAAGARRLVFDRQIAFHQRLRSPRDDDRDGRTWVEAVENGWWYSVLLPSRERLVAFLTDVDLCDTARLRDGDGLWRALAAAPRLHALCAGHDHAPDSPVRGADAGGAHLDRIAGERWLAVGDAALAFDPLSSKGLSSALYGGLRAADAILAAERGDAGATARYDAHQRDIHRVHRAQLLAFHRMEGRWPLAPFWARRHAARDASADARADARADAPADAFAGARARREANAT